MSFCNHERCNDVKVQWDRIFNISGAGMDVSILCCNGERQHELNAIYHSFADTRLLIQCSYFETGLDGDMR